MHSYVLLILIEKSEVTTRVHKNVLCTARFMQLSAPNFWAAVTTCTVAQSTERLGSCVEENRSRFNGSQHRLRASQLMGSTVQLHGLLACVPRGWVLRLRALLNTEERCAQGCWKLHETGCTLGHEHRYCTVLCVNTATNARVWSSYAYECWL